MGISYDEVYNILYLFTFVNTNWNYASNDNDNYLLSLNMVSKHSKTSSILIHMPKQRQNITFNVQIYM